MYTHTYTEKKREERRSWICWFIFQMATKVKSGPSRSQKCGTPPGFPVCGRAQLYYQGSDWSGQLPGTWTRAHMTCWHCRWKLNSVCHNIDPILFQIYIWRWHIFVGNNVMFWYMYILTYILSVEFCDFFPFSLRSWERTRNRESETVRFRASIS